MTDCYSGNRSRLERSTSEASNPSSERVRPALAWTLLGILPVAVARLLDLVGLVPHQARGSLHASRPVHVNLPLAMIGGTVAIYFTEPPSLIGNTLASFGLGERYQAPVVSIASMVDFITLFGIAARNGILLVRHYFDLLKTGVPLIQAIERVSRERLAPILMTGLNVAIGQLRLVSAAGQPGSLILAPLSAVVLSGLLTSTFLNLVVIPAGFHLLSRHRQPSPAPLENP